MAQATAEYEFNRAEFERALGVLDREQQAMQLSRAQRLSYKIYRIFVWGFVLCLVGIIVDFAIEFRKTEPPFAFLIFFLAIGLCFLFAILSLVLNIPLILKIIRHKLLFHRRGLSDFLDALWKAHQKTRRRMAIVEKTALGLGIVFLIISIIGIWISWVGAVTCFLIGTLFIMFYVLQSGKAWLDMMTSRWRDAARLKESMAALEKAAQHAGSERIPVPVDVIEQFSRIETEQIARSRAIAISESATAPRTDFSIQSSNEVLKVKAGLDPDDRLKVEETINDLMLQPKPSGVEKDADTDTLRQGVQGTDWEIVYAVDDAGRQLRLLSLRQSAMGERK
jgi:hypothetical protein